MLSCQTFSWRLLGSKCCCSNRCQSLTLCQGLVWNSCLKSLGCSALAFRNFVWMHLKLVYLSLGRSSVALSCLFQPGGYAKHLSASLSHQVFWNSWRRSHANLVCLSLSRILCLTIWLLYVWILVWCWLGEQHSFPISVVLSVLRSHFLPIADFRISVGTGLCFGTPICFRLAFVRWCSPYRWNEWRYPNLQ